MAAWVTVRAPATTANLGPGFDALGLALDLWNETRFALDGEGIRVEICGEGNNKVLDNNQNLLVRALYRVYERCQRPFPQGLHIYAENRIPWSSGLGSSAAAIVSGLLAANALLGCPLSEGELLCIATELEGHPDNVAPALLGGLTVASVEGEEVLARKLPWHPFQITVIFPEFSLPTRKAREVLPRHISLAQTSRHMARAILVTRAFAEGDLDLLTRAMQDELHQPYRLPLIPGAEEAFQVARRLGAAAALSGAGPSLIVFSQERKPEVEEEIQKAFLRAGLTSRCYHLQIAPHGAQAFQLPETSLCQGNDDMPPKF